MNRTPLIRQLRETGATMYVFPSASEDIGLNIDNRVNHVALSHYALLNFPSLTGTGKSDNQGGNVWLAEQLQNYVMNCECTLLNQNNYNYQEYHTVSERVFWKWAKKEGFLELGSGVDDWKVESVTGSDRFVQCFGSIDAGNSLSTEFGMFNETYINIPTSYGNGLVLFNDNAHDIGEQNCVKGVIYNSTGQGVLEGREDSLEQLKILDNSTPEYDEGLNNKYKFTDTIEIVKDLTDITTACNKLKTSWGTTQEFIINSYDDINVDEKMQFKLTPYDVTSNKCEFTFNAILLYYSVYDQDDPTKSAYAVNLFGIIFLDGAVKEGSSYTIHGLTKRKSFGSEANSFFGNSYSFRVNLKTMSVYDNTDSVISDNTTMSSIYSVDFSDVISNLNRAIDVMNTNVQSTMAIQDSYMMMLRNNDETRRYLDDVSEKLDAYIRGSRTSSITADNLRVNNIKPIPEEAGTASYNTVKVVLERLPDDNINSSLLEKYPTVSPILIRNGSEDCNTPAIYVPQLLSMDTANGTWVNNDVVNGVEIIGNVSVNYYSYNSNYYPNLILPEDKIQEVNIPNLYIKGDCVTGETGTNTVNPSVLYINYNAMIPLMILYIQNLQKQIDELRGN